MSTFKHVKSGHVDVGSGLIKLGTQPSYTEDVGFYSQYHDAHDATNPIKYAGLVRSNADGFYRLFDGQLSVATANDAEKLTVDDTLIKTQLNLATLSASNALKSNNLIFSATDALANNNITFPSTSGLNFTTDTGVSLLKIDPVANQVTVTGNLVASQVNLTISGISTQPASGGQYTGNIDIEGSAIAFNDTTVGHKNQIQFPATSGLQILASDQSYGIQFSNNTTDYPIPHTIAVSAANIELRGDTHQFSGFSLAVKTLTPTTTAATALDGTSSIFRIDATASNATLQLPDAAANLGRVYKIIKIDTSANTVTILPPTGQNIDQNTSNIVFDSQYDTVALVSDGTQWYAGL